MTEFSHEHEEQQEGLGVSTELKLLVAEQLTREDAEFLDDLDEESQLGYVYGRLLEEGKDPDQLLVRYGVIEQGETE